VIRSATGVRDLCAEEPKRTLQAENISRPRLRPGMDVFWKLAKGDVYQQPFTVREGETMFDIGPRNWQPGNSCPRAIFFMPRATPH